MIFKRDTGGNSLEDRQRRLDRRLLSILLLLSVLANVVTIATYAWFEGVSVLWTNPVEIVALVMLPMLGGLLVANRAGYSQCAAFGMVLLLCAACYASFFLMGSTTPVREVWVLSYLLIPMIVASMFFSRRVVLGLVIANAFGMALVPLVTEADFSRVPLVFFLLGSGLLLSSVWHHRMVEQLRRQQIRASERHFEDLFENAPVGYHELDALGRIMRVNSTELAMLGYRRPEMLGRFVWEFTPQPAAMREAVLAKLSGALGDVPLAERQYVRKDGTLLELLAQHQLLRDEQGRVEGLRTGLLDITGRKRAEAENLRLAAAVENAAESIFVMDAQGVIQYANPAFERITGYDRDEAVGKTASLLKSGSHSDAFYESFWQTLRTGTVWKGRFTNRRKDGTLCQMEGAVSPIAGEGQAVDGYVAVQRDITKELELEARIRHSQKMEAIGTLAGGIAHDFNNMLSVILGYSRLALEDTQPDNPTHHHLANVLQAAERAAGLVQQILTYSRRSEQARQPLQLQLILKEALHFLRASLPSTIEVRQDVSPACGPVYADPTQMHQVVMNLCTNAFHAMAERGGTLEVTLKPLAVDADFAAFHPPLKPGSHVLLQVKDTGAGIPPEIMDRIFEPFFTTKETGEGTGMGLATVQAIVNTHGGLIDACSMPGEGSTFEVYLPCSHTASVPEPPPEAPEIRRAGGQRLLVVDDEPAVAGLLARALRKAGYVVRDVTDSVEALELLRHDARAFDLVITDQTMPHMTGLELARQAKRIRPDLPIILTTGYRDSEQAEEFTELGFAGFLAKPADLHQLARVVHDALGSTAGGNDRPPKRDASAPIEYPHSQ
mgnify:CR=1 FL=1